MPKQHWKHSAFFYCVSSVMMHIRSGINMIDCNRLWDHSWDHLSIRDQYILCECERFVGSNFTRTDERLISFVALITMRNQQKFIYLAFWEIMYKPFESCSTFCQDKNDLWNYDWSKFMGCSLDTVHNYSIIYQSNNNYVPHVFHCQF